MTEILDDTEQLIADLLEEANQLRAKYEEFSKFTEEKVAEFVQIRKQLTKERDDALRDLAVLQQELSQTQHDLQVLRLRQDQLHHQLVNTSERVKALESSRAVRLAERLRKLRRR